MAGKGKSQNGVPTIKWVSQHYGAIHRQFLFLEGRKTPYFVDTALMRCHYTHGDRYGLYGAGMHERGCAAILGSSGKITVLKHRAEQYALERIAA